MLVCAFFRTILHTRPRVQRASGIPCSLLFGGTTQSSGKIVPRECGRTSAVWNFESGFTVVPALSRDPYAAAVMMEGDGRRSSLSTSRRSAWVPAQGRDDERSGMRGAMTVMDCSGMSFWSDQFVHGFRSPLPQGEVGASRRVRDYAASLELWPFTRFAPDDATRRRGKSPLPDGER